MLENTDTKMVNSTFTIEDIECVVGLIRRGDQASLAKARQKIGIPVSQIASSVGISENLLNKWENGKAKPENGQLIAWRLKLGDFLDEKIAAYIGTANKDLITQFWEIMWRLNDLEAPS
ncbi:MAG: helix-turn-helix transcriptional regulator [Dehalococcoidales bacterium]|nr:helix-turn-helix transcriptional regulator [Dehalococcoidales bacterium]